MSFRFFHTLNSRPAHWRGCASWLGRLARHSIWQVRKRAGGYPKKLKFGGSFLWIQNAKVADACGSLVNLFGYYDGNLHLLGKLKQYAGGSSFLDVGANAGVYTIAASEGGNGFRVTAFEAHPATVELLRDNVRKNDRLNVTVEHTAVSDTAGVLRFSDVAGSPVNHVLGRESGGGIEVPAVRLDDYAASRGLRPVGMKVDVEGHEPQVLEGARRILRNDVEFVFLEENNPSPLLALMRELGFQGPYYYHTGRASLSGTPEREDAVFLKPACLAWLRDNGVPLEEGN